MLWTLAVTLCFLTVFGLYPDAEGEHMLSRATHLVYQPISKIVWSVCLSFIIYSCVSSKGGI